MFTKNELPKYYFGEISGINNQSEEIIIGKETGKRTAYQGLYTKRSLELQTYTLLKHESNILNNIELHISEPILSRITSPTSSITSTKKLEWDSGADIGYISESLKKRSKSYPILRTDFTVIDEINKFHEVPIETISHVTDNDNLSEISKNYPLSPIINMDSNKSKKRNSFKHSTPYESKTLQIVKSNNSSDFFSAVSGNKHPKDLHSLRDECLQTTLVHKVDECIQTDDYLDIPTNYEPLKSKSSSKNSQDNLVSYETTSSESSFKYVSGQEYKSKTYSDDEYPKKLSINVSTHSDNQLEDDYEIHVNVRTPYSNTSTCSRSENKREYSLTTVPSCTEKSYSSRSTEPSYSSRRSGTTVSEKLAVENMPFGKFITTQHSTNLIEDIDHSLLLLQKLNMNDYSSDTKKFYAKKIITKIVQSKYSDDSSSTSSTDLSRRGKSRMSSYKTGKSSEEDVTVYVNKIPAKSKFRMMHQKKSSNESFPERHIKLNSEKPKTLDALFIRDQIKENSEGQTKSQASSKQVSEKECTPSTASSSHYKETKVIGTQSQKEDSVKVASATPSASSSRESSKKTPSKDERTFVSCAVQYDEPKDTHTKIVTSTLPLDSKSTQSKTILESRKSSSASKSSVTSLSKEKLFTKNVEQCDDKETDSISPDISELNNSKQKSNVEIPVSSSSKSSAEPQFEKKTLVSQAVQCDLQVSTKPSIKDNSSSQNDSFENKIRESSSGSQSVKMRPEKKLYVNRSMQCDEEENRITLHANLINKLETDINNLLLEHKNKVARSKSSDTSKSCGSNYSKEKFVSCGVQCGIISDKVESLTHKLESDLKYLKLANKNNIETCKLSMCSKQLVKNSELTSAQQSPDTSGDSLNKNWREDKTLSEKLFEAKMRYLDEPKPNPSVHKMKSSSSRSHNHPRSRFERNHKHKELIHYSKKEKHRQLSWINSELEYLRGLKELLLQVSESPSFSSTCTSSLVNSKDDSTISQTSEHNYNDSNSSKAAIQTPKSSELENSCKSKLNQKESTSANDSFRSSLSRESLKKLSKYFTNDQLKVLIQSNTATLDCNCMCCRLRNALKIPEVVKSKEDNKTQLPDFNKTKSSVTKTDDNLVKADSTLTKTDSNNKKTDSSSTKSSTAAAVNLSEIESKVLKTIDLIDRSCQVSQTSTSKTFASESSKGSKDSKVKKEMKDADIQCTIKKHRKLRGDIHPETIITSDSTLNSSNSTRNTHGRKSEHLLYENVENFKSSKTLTVASATTVSDSEFSFRRKYSSVSSSCELNNKENEADNYNTRDCNDIQKGTQGTMQAIKPIAYQLTFEEVSADDFNSDNRSKRSLEKVTVKVPRMRKTFSQKVADKQTTNKSNSLLTLQEYLCKNRPDFVEAAEWRRKCVSNCKADSHNVFTCQEMKQITLKQYKHLPEVQDKVRQSRIEDERRYNRKQANLFSKKLQRKTLKGQISLSTCVSVMAPL